MTILQRVGQEKKKQLLRKVKQERKKKNFLRVPGWVLAQEGGNAEGGSKEEGQELKF